MAVPQKSHAGDERLIGYFTVKEMIGHCGIFNMAQWLSVCFLIWGQSESPVCSQEVASGAWVMFRTTSAPFPYFFERSSSCCEDEQQRFSSAVCAAGAGSDVFSHHWSVIDSGGNKKFLLKVPQAGGRSQSENEGRHINDTFYFYGIKGARLQQQPKENQPVTAWRCVTMAHHEVVCIFTGGPVGHMTTIAWNPGCITVNVNRFKSAKAGLLWSPMIQHRVSLLVKTETQMASSPFSGVIQEKREEGKKRREGGRREGWKGRERERERGRQRGVREGERGEESYRFVKDLTKKRGLWVYKGGRWWENNDRRRRLCDLRWPLAGLLGRAEGNGCHRSANVVGHPAACPLAPLPAIMSALTTSESPLQEHRNTPAVSLSRARMAFMCWRSVKVSELDAWADTADWLTSLSHLC